MDSIVCPVVEKIRDCLFDAAGREFGYWIHCEDNFERLKDEAENLADLRERVQGKIDEAIRKGDIILAYVKKWTIAVDGITEEVESFVEEEDKANARCFDPLSRYRFGKEAERKTKEILKLQKRGEGFEIVSRLAPPPDIITSSALSVNFQSRELVKEKIMECLMDENVSVIGICGMVGVGKTTLVKQISEQVMKNELFDRVAMTVVSQTQSYVKIQEDIARILGFALADDDESVRASYLWGKLVEREKRDQQERVRKWKLNRKQHQKQKLGQILIILDDVWKRIELERIGIPFGNDLRGCKVMLTSRIEDVCNEMHAKTFKIETLPEKDSWDLFRMVAGEIVDNSDIQPIAREVADECDGLPIAIVTLATALRNKDNKYVWIHAKQLLQKSALTDIKGMDQKVFASLELSYNSLEKEEEKSVFLLCCLFPEDFDIPIELLMRYAIGLRLFQEDVVTVEEARVRTHAIVSTLASCFLVITNPDKYHVRMHDVIRDVAIKLSEDTHKTIAQAGLGLQEWPSADKYKNSTRISLMYNDILEVEDGLEYPNLQALLLQENPSLVVSDNFFQGMKDVEVLDMSRIGSWPLPLSLLLLSNLTVLCLNDCMFGELSISLIGKLTKLEILSLKGTDIKEIPGDFGQLVKLKFLDMTGCFNLRHLPEAVILCLKKLEELYISIGNHYEVRGFLIELQSLSRHIILRICNQAFRPRLTNLLGYAIMSSRLPSLNRKSFVIEIGNGSLEPLKECPPWSRILYIAGISYRSVDWRNVHQSLIKITEVLQLCEIADLMNFLLDLGNLEFSDLKFLQLSHCGEITYLLKTLESTPCTFLDSLESLSMDTMLNMVEICDGPPPAESFCKLKKMSISECHRMLAIVPSHLLQRLRSLEILEASSCMSAESVFEFERLGIAGEETKFLSSLKNLNLVSMRKMKQIWKGDAKLISLCNLNTIFLTECSKLRQVFPPSLLQSLASLKRMEISDCTLLEEIFGKVEEEEDETIVLNVDHTTTSPSLGNLAYIQISGCHNLKNLFSPSIVKGLVHLGTLVVRHCTAMEEIVSDAKAETGASTEMITLPSLQTIYLEGLDRLNCFCAGWFTIELPKLDSLDIKDCSKMETFGCGDTVTPNLKMDTNVQKFFKKKKEQDAVRPQLRRTRTIRIRIPLCCT